MGLPTGSVAWVKTAGMLVREIAVWGGLAAMGVGLWWERPSVALIVVGGIVFFGAVRRK